MGMSVLSGAVELLELELQHFIEYSVKQLPIVPLLSNVHPKMIVQSDKTNGPRHSSRP